MLDDEEIPPPEPKRPLAWLARLPKQLALVNPFDGDSKPSRVKLFARGRPTLPFPHPWNYTRPLDILEAFFVGADREAGPARNNRFLEFPGSRPVLVSRDPDLIREILKSSSENPGAFDRDTLPTNGIGRATGTDTLLYANGPLWKRQRLLATPPFKRSKLFQPEKFRAFEETFRETIQKRLAVLRDIVRDSESQVVRVRMETEIEVVMLEMLVNNFFGAAVPYEEIRDRFTPALHRVIDHIVRDTVTNKIGVPITRWPSLTPKIAQIKRDYEAFEELTDLSLAPRKEAKGLWNQFKSDASDEALRSNIRVFLAGALEATTSYAAWAIAHLSRHPADQEKVYQEIKDIDTYTPDNLNQSRFFNQVLNETLRLTPSLYFLPRTPTVDTWVEMEDGRKLFMPRGTHVLLDVWHANRVEEYWGVEKSGYPATDFEPARWDQLEKDDYVPRKLLHYGFGHGQRVCPGKFLGQLEVGLVVGALVRTFKFRAVHEKAEARVGVSTKPADGALVDLELR